MNNTEKFIEKAIAKHGNLYDYTNTAYTKAADKVLITCSVHGDFKQTASAHLQGTGCPECGRERSTAPKIKDTAWFIEQANITHDNRYDYSKTIYIKSTLKVAITCPDHGDFDQTPAAHLYGQKCPQCALIQRAKKRTKSTDWFIDKAKKVHGDMYDYNNADYLRNKEKIKIVCEKHGEFEQTPADHLQGRGCQACAKEYTAEQVRLSFNEFVTRATSVHGDRYKYNNYIDYETPVEIICNDHGVFLQKPGIHIGGCGCSKCTTKDSKAERDIRAFVKSLDIDVEDSGNRIIIKPKELDIVIPSKRMAIEHNGLYWHNDVLVDANEARFKYDMAASAGYELITIFEDEWVERTEVIKKVLKHRLGISEKGLPARKLTIKEITNELAHEFLNKEHIQGAPYSTKAALGAFDGDSLVAVMTFGHPTRQNSAEWELSRFATDGVSHAGLANKLFKSFIKNYNPREIVSFSDNRWFNGGVYEKLGFVLDKELPIDYSYVKGEKRFHKSSFRKDLISKKFNYVFAEGETEREAMQKLGYLRIWDCGKKRWVWNSP